MVAKDLIIGSVPTVKTSDNGEDALSLMEDFKISHLPIVNNTDFLGLISDTDIYDLKKPEEAIGNHKLSLESAFVLEQAHLYDVAEIMTRMKLSVIPVVNEEREYLGAITDSRLAHALAEMLAISGPGGIIVLMVKEVNYSMTEIARIVEDNSAKILSSSLVVEPASRMFEVTLKLNVEDITSVIKSFERYGYHIENYYMSDGKLDTVLQERFDALVRYLDV